MKKLKKFLFAAFTVAILSCLLCQPAFAAISESDVQAQVDAVGKEAVSGNVFIWFLCAIGFLKVGQKIDSFLSSLGVNVGHTGGSMLAEAMLLPEASAASRTFPVTTLAAGGTAVPPMSTQTVVKAAAALEQGLPAAVLLEW